jgi:hypothetical protein
MAHYAQMCSRVTQDAPDRRSSYHEAMKIALALLLADGVVLLCYGVLSLLFVRAPVQQPFFSLGRILYGVLPAALGFGSLWCAVWLGFTGRSKSGRNSFK